LSLNFNCSISFSSKKCSKIKSSQIWIDYQKTHSKKNTISAYQAVIERFLHEFGDGHVDEATPEQILTFLNRFTNGNKAYNSRTQQRCWPAPVEASILFNRFLITAALDTRPRPDRPVGKLDQSWRFSQWEKMRTVR
jgi:hypothetical protein